MVTSDKHESSEGGPIFVGPEIKTARSCRWDGPYRYTFNIKKRGDQNPVVYSHRCKSDSASCCGELAVVKSALAFLVM